MRHVIFCTIVAFLTVLCLAPRAGGTAETVARKDYAVAVSQSTYDRDDWKPVVEALVKKYRAE